MKCSVSLRSHVREVVSVGSETKKSTRTLYIYTFIYMYISLYPDQDQPVVNDTACPRTHDARFLDHIMKVENQEEESATKKSYNYCNFVCSTFERTETSCGIKSSVYLNNKKRNHLPIRMISMSLV